MQNSGIVTIDLSNHPVGAPLGMLLAPGALPSTHLVGGSNAASNSTYVSHGTCDQSDEKNNHHLLQQQNNYQNETQYSRHVLVAGWEHSTLNSNQLLGPIQRSGVIRLGDRLVRINHVDITDWTFREVMDALKEMISSESSAPAGSSYRKSTREMSHLKRRLKSLGFAPSNSIEWSRGIDTPEASFHSYISLADYLFSSNNKNDRSVGKDQCIVHSKRLYSFASFIAGWRVVNPNATKDKNRSELEGESEKVDSAGEPTPPLHNMDSTSFYQEVERDNGGLKESSESDPLSQVDDAQKMDESVRGQECEHVLIEDSPNAPQPQVSDQSKNETGSNNKPKPKTPEKPLIQYEIECHLLFRDPQSFNKTNFKSPNNSVNSVNDLQNNIYFGKNTHHHKWSTWKRYSEFSALDTELRTTFGWQMNALHDGKGIAFPSSHDLESWWYGIRRGKGDAINSDGSGVGYLSYFIGGSSSNKNGTKCKHENVNGMNRGLNAGSSDGEGGMASGLVSYFRSGNQYAENSPSKSNFFAYSDLNNNQQLLDDTTPDNSIQPDAHIQCPYPPSFMNKRQKELFNYWADLMKIEDIFEFSDVNSHRFGKVMADFLGVSKILEKRSPLARHLAASLTRTNVPVIYENETPGFGAAVSPHVFATSAMSGLNLRDMDDESTLSDDNVVFGNNRQLHTKGIPCNRKEVVDVIPNLEFINGADATSDCDGHDILYRKLCVDASRMLDNTDNDDTFHRHQSSSRTLGARRGQKGVKPAFQRQFLVP